MVGVDEIPGEFVFLVHEGSFSELRIEAGFAEASNALDAADGVFVEDVVVAEPEFEGKIAADGNEAMELGVVTDGPREAREKCDGESEQRKLERHSCS